VVEHPQLGTLKRLRAYCRGAISPHHNQERRDPDDAAKKKPTPETTITGFKVPTAVAYINAAGKIVRKRGP